jgi:hypothetical protein
VKYLNGALFENIIAIFLLLLPVFSSDDEIDSIDVTPAVLQKSQVIEIRKASQELPYQITSKNHLQLLFF